jgi:hypothetical protein
VVCSVEVISTGIVHASTRNRVFSFSLQELIFVERNLFIYNTVLFCFCCISEVYA